jgi:hypothetical protein
MWFREIIAAYYENHTKPVNTLCEQNAELLTIKVGGTYSYHWALKGKKKMLFRVPSILFEYYFFRSTY